jgi:dolichol kinase
MADPIKVLIIIALYFVINFVSESIYKKFNLRAETTRKIVHTSVGILTLLFPFIFDNYLPVAIICIIFLLVAWLSKQFKFLNSINDIFRKSYGSIMDPIIAFILFLGYDFVGTICCDTPQYVLYVLPMLIGAFCDPIAASIGRRYPLIKTINTKSLGGFSAFVISAVLISIGCFLIFIPTMTLNEMIKVSVGIAVVGAISETATNKGLDNFVIPLSTFVMTYLLLY